MLNNVCVQTPEHQTVLFNHGAIQNIAPLLISPSYKVQKGTEWLFQLLCMLVLALNDFNRLTQSGGWLPSECIQIV